MGSSQAEDSESIKHAVCRDVIFDHISPKLLERELISSEEYQKIKAKETDSEQTAQLLDILSFKGSPALKNFAEILEDDYPWLSELLKKNSVPADMNKTPKISRLAKGVTQEMMAVVQKNYRVADKWTTLAHSLGLTKRIMDIRIRVNMYGEQNSMCILYLLQEWVGVCSHEATLGRLLQILRDQEFNDIADELEEKFA